MHDTAAGCILYAIKATASAAEKHYMSTEQHGSDCMQQEHTQSGSFKVYIPYTSSSRKRTEPERTKTRIG